MVAGLSKHPNIDSLMTDEAQIKWADGVMLICGGVGFVAVDLRYFPSEISKCEVGTEKGIAA